MASRSATRGLIIRKPWARTNASIAASRPKCCPLLLSSILPPPSMLSSDGAPSTTRNGRTKHSSLPCQPAAIGRARAIMSRPLPLSNTHQATPCAGSSKVVTSASSAATSKSRRPSAAKPLRSGKPHRTASSTSSSEPRRLQPSTSGLSTERQKVSTMSPNTCPPSPRSEHPGGGRVADQPGELHGLADIFQHGGLVEHEQWLVASRVVVLDHRHAAVVEYQP